jgi:centrosomal protein POC5
LIELGNEYEVKYKQLELELLNAHEEIARLKVDKGEHDEALKKAFMRGVCALNMEAMSVLLKNENELETTTSTKEEPQQQRRCCNRKSFVKHKLKGVLKFIGFSPPHRHLSNTMKSNSTVGIC